MQAAEDARLIAVQRQEEARLEKERTDAAEREAQAAERAAQAAGSRAVFRRELRVSRSISATVDPPFLLPV